MPPEQDNYLSRPERDLIQGNHAMDPSALERVQQLESLRVQLEAASMRYKAATAQYRDMLEAQTEEAAQGPEATDALVRCLQAEAEARVEYGRILRMFTDLAMHGEVPQARSAAAADGA
ncbi:hypothetical protein [Paludibaculum fermentans]|uniref:hypothetical protein n=1 Tax=Paludibaculum fermentans TaxID=1473598 RepID=UPI003EBF58B7